jgi:hypothetical protein
VPSTRAGWLVPRERSANRPMGGPISASTSRVGPRGPVTRQRCCSGRRRRTIRFPKGAALTAPPGCSNPSVSTSPNRAWRKNHRTEAGQGHSYHRSPSRATGTPTEAVPLAGDIAGDLSCPRGGANRSGAAGGGLQVRAVPPPRASRRVTSRPSKEPSVSASEMSQTEPNVDAGLMWRTASSLTWLLWTHVPVL